MTERLWQSTAPEAEASDSMAACNSLPHKLLECVVHHHHGCGGVQIGAAHALWVSHGGHGPLVLTAAARCSTIASLVLVLVSIAAGRVFFTLALGLQQGCAGILSEQCRPWGCISSRCPRAQHWRRFPTHACPPVVGAVPDCQPYSPASSSYFQNKPKVRSGTCRKRRMIPAR